MAHLDENIDELSMAATLPEVIAKLNEIIKHMNHMWSPEDLT